MGKYKITEDYEVEKQGDDEYPDGRLVKEKVTIEDDRNALGEKVLTTEHVYDELGRAKMTRRFVGDEEKLADRELYFYEEGDQTATGTLKTINYLLGDNTELKAEYTYDKNGNIASEKFGKTGHEKTTSYKYDSNNRLVREDNEALGKSYEYEYDGNNYRVFKQTPSEKTYYNYDGSGNLRFERRGRTEINYVYDSNGIQGMRVTVPTKDAATYYASEEYYYIKDRFGNVRVILDKSGNIMVEYNYDAWGNFVAEKVREVCIGSVTVDLAELNAFTYRGYYYDKESGLYYLINRYYDPTTGRFISPDDVGYLDFESFFGTNRYAYCLDDPVNYIDPEGTMPNWLKWVIGGIAFVGAVVLTYFSGGALAPVFISMGLSIAGGALFQGTINAIHGQDFWQGFADGAADGAMWGGIFALAGATIDFLKNLQLIKSRGVVIGKGMKRVEYLADQAALSKYSPMKGYKLIKGNGNSIWRTKLADRLSIAHNRAWINRVMRLKKPIYDIGLDASRIAGAWYGMELEEISQYMLHLYF